MSKPDIDDPNTIEWAADDDIGKILLRLVNHIEENYGERYLTLASKEIEEAKQALYQRLLTVIGADDVITPYPAQRAGAIARNYLRADQRKALAELMGVAE